LHHISSAIREYSRAAGDTHGIAEKKWFRNTVIASQDLYAFDYKTKSMKVKKQETFEDREIKVLSNHMRQSVIEKSTAT
jgi:hypothetical protein